MLQPTHMLYLHRKRGWTTRNYNLSASIFLVNHQIYGEAKDTFYRYVDFNITLAPASLNRILPGIACFPDFDLVLANFLLCIRNLDINIDWEHEVISADDLLSTAHGDRLYKALRNMPTLTKVSLHWRLHLEVPHRLVLNARPNVAISCAKLRPFRKLQDRRRNMEVLVQRAYYPFLGLGRGRRFWQPPVLPMQRHWYEDYDGYVPLKTLLPELRMGVRLFLEGTGSL